MKRVLSILLALTLLCSVFSLVACGDTGATNTTDDGDLDFSGSGTVGTTQATLEPGEGFAGNTKHPDYEDVDFAGHIFTFSSPISATDGWADYEVYAEEDSEGILNASIIERNNIMSDLYNCGIEVEDSANGTLSNDFATNQNRIDLALHKYNMNSKANGDYYNIHSLDIDLERSWWDTNFIEDATVDGKLYAVLGAFSLTSFDATWVMFFNKTVLENNEKIKNEDIYELVKTDKWTLDKFYELVKKATSEDGNQTMETGTNDIYGLVSSTFGIRGLYFGADQGYSIKTDNVTGTSEFNHAFTDAAVEATNKVIEIYDDPGVAVIGYTTVESQMRSGLTLFAPEVLRMASYYGGAQGSSTEAVDIGIVPHPKLTKDQQNYKHNVDNHIIYLCVPKTCTDLQRIADFLTLYAFHSKYTVYEDYLNLYKFTYTNDSEAADMVDIILNSRSFDLCYQFNWAGVDTEYLAAVQAGRNVIAELRGSLGNAIVESANAYKDKLAELK